jgi:MFS family permease
MLGWFAELNPKERRTMGACFGGWALDAFDVQMYSFVIPTVIALWGLSRGQAGLIGTVTLLISSLGGWFSGTLADRFGRVRMLQITILWYSVFTFLCAFAQNFEQLFVLRALHGLGFGGEWAAGAVLMGEVIRDKYRGRGVGLVQTGWAVGWGASALVYTGLYAFLPEEIAWRALFAIGLLPAVFVFWIRRLSAPSTGGFLLVQIFGALLGFLLGTYLSDVIGRKWTFLLSAIGTLLMVAVYMTVPMDNTILLFMGIPLFVILLMKFPPMGPFMTELFPTAVRGTAQGFCYNAGRGIGALFPALVGFLSETMSLGAAIVVFSSLASGIMILMLLTLPETRGRSLESLEAGTADAPRIAFEAQPMTR